MVIRLEKDVRNCVLVWASMVMVAGEVVHAVGGVCM
jgi:hypothetical protein